MTYWQFHIVFTIPLFLLVAWVTRNNPYSISQKAMKGTALLLFLAITYTTPWDSYLIHQGIWTYEPGRVLGTLFLIPFEEYFFFIIQTIIGCLFTGWVLSRFASERDHAMELGSRQLFGLLIGLALVGGGALAFQPTGPYRYLYLVTFWSLPVLVMQWSLGLSILRRQWRTWLFSVMGLTTYFSIADSVAIGLQIWTFPADTISGWQIFGVLPIEEFLFFLVTNLMVVQGFILFTTVDFKKFQFSVLSGAKS